jgi:hypothetical protein
MTRRSEPLCASIPHPKTPPCDRRALEVMIWSSWGRPSGRRDAVFRQDRGRSAGELAAVGAVCVELTWIPTSRKRHPSQEHGQSPQSVLDLVDVELQLPRGYAGSCYMCKVGRYRTKNVEINRSGGSFAFPTWRCWPLRKWPCGSRSIIRKVPALLCPWNCE